jgi:hypothetical protein
MFKLVIFMLIKINGVHLLTLELMKTDYQLPKVSTYLEKKSMKQEIILNIVMKSILKTFQY